MLGQHASTPRKEKKHPNSSQATDRLTGEEEQNGKQKRTKRRNREGVPNPATLNHSVSSYDEQEPYGKPILFTPPPPGPQGGINK